ncbi:hypothetical protein GJ496_003474 [Pomphorhynchus laevis]|nr:hypothetical protein GJ496_003474 [Pomphorhynchus laevis]
MIASGTLKLDLETVTSKIPDSDIFVICFFTMIFSERINRDLRRSERIKQTKDRFLTEFTNTCCKLSRVLLIDYFRVICDEELVKSIIKSSDTDIVSVNPPSYSRIGSIGNDVAQLLRVKVGKSLVKAILKNGLE